MGMLNRGTHKRHVYKTVPSPVGRLTLVATADGLSAILWEKDRPKRVPLDLASGTAFQRKVWNALLTIPFGETRSYRQIARQIGSPAAVRAVGAANGRNPLSIIAPCHRVIGSNGKLTGFAGGLDAKARLLALEGVCSGSPPPSASVG